MNLQFFIRYFRFASLVFLLFAIGCGKKVSTEKKASKPAPTVSPVLSEEEKFLQKQQLICENEYCPESIVKVVSFEKRTPRICTGFLVKDDVVVTSSSCLPDILRKNDQDCSTDVHFFLPKTRRSEATRLSCQKVLLVSELEGKRPVLWRDDLAFLRLSAKTQDRKPFIFSRSGIENKFSYTMWGVEQIDEEIAFLRKQSCLSVHNSFINPLASDVSSPKQVFANCFFKNGSHGAPLFDEKGRILSVASNPVSIDLIEYIKSTGLLKIPLVPMLHATNLSCAPTIFNVDVLNERECFKVISDDELNNAREKTIKDETAFESKREELTRELEESNIFLNFKILTENSNNLRLFKITPNCFKNLSSWLWRVTSSRGNYGFSLQLPLVKMRRYINFLGEVKAEVTSDLQQEIYVEFSVKQLKKTKTSPVTFWGDTSSENFPFIGENCQ